MIVGFFVLPISSIVSLDKGSVNKHVREAILNLLTPIDFRKNATETEFLGSILDFILSKDIYTLEFCASHDYEQQSISIARQFLPGSHLPNWT